MQQSPWDGQGHQDQNQPTQQVPNQPTQPAPDLPTQQVPQQQPQPQAQPPQQPQYPQQQPQSAPPQQAPPQPPQQPQQPAPGYGYPAAGIPEQATQQFPGQAPPPPPAPTAQLPQQSGFGPAPDMTGQFSGQPGFGQPGFGQPGGPNQPGGPGQPPWPGLTPPARRKPWLLPTIAVAVAAALAAGALVWSPWDNAGKGGDPDSSASAKAKKKADPVAVATKSVQAAADRLEKARLTGYKGEYKDAVDGQTSIDIKTTPSGLGHGKLGGDSQNLDLLTADEKTFIKGSRDYWKSKGYKDEMADTYRDRWVKASLLTGGSRIASSMAPKNIAEQMRKAAETKDIEPGEKSTVGGATAQAIKTGDGTYFVTTKKPFKLVRIETAGSSSDGGGSETPGDGTESPGGGTEVDESAKPVTYTTTEAAAKTTPAASSDLPSGLGVDVTEPAEGTEQDTFANDYKDAIGNLKNSINSEQGFRSEGKSVLSPCNNSGCTVTVKLKNTSVEISPDSDESDDKLRATIRIRVKLDGTVVKDCLDERDIARDSVTTIVCRASYNASRSSSHRVLANITEATIHAATPTQITQYRNDFDTEWGANP